MLIESLREPLPSDLTGRMVVVTGAARGIGLAIACRLLQGGARVTAVDRDGEALRAALGAEPGCRCVVADLGECDLAQLAKEILHQDRHVELIVHTSASPPGLELSELEEATFDYVFRSNVRAPMFLTRYLLEPVLERPGREGEPPWTGSVVLVSSVHGRLGAGNIADDTSRAHLPVLGCELAAQLGPHGVRVNTVFPGATRSALDPDAPGRAVRYGWPSPRVPGRPDDVARLVVILLSDRHSGDVTGQTIWVDGGLSLRSRGRALPRPANGRRPARSG
ncbi:MAG TPA: SDR family oxidoreductase [Actinomycetes bacterium]|nr:SDR family oxidoreductase [Actinomycetes bacterium]